jgi:hypothetical protein
MSESFLSSAVSVRGRPAGDGDAGSRERQTDGDQKLSCVRRVHICMVMVCARAFPCLPGVTAERID